MPRAKQNGTPSPTATTAVIDASRMLFTSAREKSGSVNADWYQERVNPSMGRLSRGDVVNEKRTTTSTGRNRYRSTTSR